MESARTDRRGSFFVIDDFGAADDFVLEDADRVLEIDPVLLDIASCFFMVPFELVEVKTSDDPFRVMPDAS